MNNPNPIFGDDANSKFVEARSMRRVSFGLAVLAALTAVTAVGCDESPPVNQVGVNVVEKGIFEGSWYVSRTVIDVDYEAAGAGTFPGDAAYDNAASVFGFSLPRVRWVIDEDFLYAYRDYELIEGAGGDGREAGDELGHPVAAYPIESHFDINRAYSSVTGEERNVIVENTSDRRWYERQFMRVDWSKNILPGYYGQTYQLYETLGLWTREPTDLYVQGLSEFPDSWRPQFDYMPCDGSTDSAEGCTPGERDLADDYAKDELYHMAFVGQELMSPGTVPDPWTGQPINFCVSPYSDAPRCNTNAIYVRTSYLKVSDTRQYDRVNWTDTRFERAGYFRLSNQTYDRSIAADDPAYGYTDFKNYSALRHNLWKQWRDAEGNPVPYVDRDVRQVVWYSSHELPAHLVKPSFALVGEWNAAFMSTIRNQRAQADAFYPRVACQTADPDTYCFCSVDPDTGEQLRPDSDGDGIGDCAGRYDPFITPEDAAASGAVAPYQCHVVATDAEPDMNAPGLTDTDFNGWFDAHMVGEECATILRINTCNRRSVAANGDTMDGLDCQERGDMRYKFLSYVDQPGTAFLGIATLRGDPVTGEVMAGDANIGGPALDGYRTYALQQYDLINGNITEQELLTGENIRSYLENVNNVEQPAPPRIDFSVASQLGGAAAQPGEMERLHEHMGNIVARTEQLQGPEGRRNIYSDRLQTLAGTDLERRLMDNVETYAMLGFKNLPEGAHMTESILDMASPFRGNDALSAMDEFMNAEQDASSMNMMLPNEYVDDSVTAFVQAHADWPRARLEFALNRMLFFETELHEMGHCMGLRHSFEASADHNNYYDDYYLINDRFPLPDPTAFDTDGTHGLSSSEQVLYEDAYNGARSQRERAGIDQWMNTSVMEYTKNWYQRAVGVGGRYDFHAIGMGYGDMTEVYDNSAGLAVDDITPVNTPRQWAKYYHGGEACEVDADCPFSAGGTSAGELLPTNMTTGLTQTCVPNPRSSAIGNVCSGYDEDLAQIASATAAPAWAPVDYMYCTDERATGGGTTPGTLGLCNRFDEGDSYREIVRNVIEAYDRMYLWQNFRRYKSGFNIGNYLFSRMIGRHFVILQNIYQNLLYNYTSDPEFRNNDGAFGFQDQFLATADIMNFYARVLASPDVGAYRWNEGWQRYQRASVDPDLPGAQLSLPLGMAKYAGTVYQSGLTGIQRIERIGTFYDKWFVMQLMSQRGVQSNYTPDVAFFANFYDLFPLEMNSLFGGFIRNDPTAYAPRMECEGTFPNCDNPRLVYMDLYRGDCFTEGSTSCRPDPVSVTYRDMPVLDAGVSTFLQAQAAINGLSQFPVYYDTTFQNQLFVCIEGHGGCYSPSAGAVEGVDYVRYSSRRYGKAFLAFQVEPSATVTTQTSIGFEMVSEAADLDFIVRMLQTFRGDFGGPPRDMTNLTAAETARLTAMGYTIPADAETLDTEENRLYGRLESLESFFNLLIQLENQYGIFG